MRFCIVLSQNGYFHVVQNFVRFSREVDSSIRNFVLRIYF